MLEVVQKRAQDAYTYGSGVMGKIFTFFKGRSTFFAVFFTITGTVLAFMGKLTYAYVSMIGAIQGFVVVHSVKEDFYAQPDAPAAATDAVPRVTDLKV